MSRFDLRTSLRRKIAVGIRKDKRFVEAIRLIAALPGDEPLAIFDSEIEIDEHSFSCGACLHLFARNSYGATSVGQ